MGNLKLARVDNRYIHGQVSARLVREYNITKILLISDAYAADPFMTELYQAMAIGFTVDVLPIREAATKWNAGDYKSEPSVLLLWGTIQDAVATYKAGLAFHFLALANIPGGTGKVRVNNSCYIDSKEANQLRDLNAEGVDIYFQAMADMPKVTLADALKITNL